ncbi:alpha/beta hydrolase [Micrococcus sp.]|uniref:alpha/beta fold hydrolase n=1 Tax=Micrococcus sp. TaxID=1271 RepID=UPI002A90BA05|nr:alpha/beta hydrolase [Micrococcus sp.]MDY6054667.1 alpha/beta hydrolase [Micrococcus sp.]
MLHHAEYGDPAGVPVVHFHGTPGSRLEGGALDAAARTAGVRLIVPDRPGMGRSPHVPGRRLQDWPATFTQLLDGLGVERVGVLAWSGGGPYAVAVLAHAPERVRSVGLLAPAGLLPRVPWANRLMPHVYMPVVSLAARARDWGPTAALAQYRMRRARTRLEVPERTPLAPSAAAVLADSWREGFRHGPAGPIRDELVINEDWGALVPRARAAVDQGVPVRLWHGRRDRTVAHRHSRRLASALGAYLVDSQEGDHAGALLVSGPEALAFLS